MIEDKIINIDVLEGLRSLPDNSIDLIVTSPPFNKGEWSLNRRQPSYTKRRHIDYGDWTILNINNAPILEGGGGIHTNACSYREIFSRLLIKRNEK